MTPHYPGSKSEAISESAAVKPGWEGARGVHTESDPF
jgi:hypothetical protein